MNKRRHLVLFPVLLAIYPVLNLYAVNVELLKISQIFRSLAITIALTSTLWLALGQILGNIAKAGYLVSVGVILFFSYGHIYDALPPTMAHRNLLLLSAGLFVLTLATVLILKRSDNRHDTVPYFNVVSVILVTISLIQIGSYEFSIEIQTSRLATAPLDGSGSSTAASDTLPDIYYIILDGYASEDVLFDYYGYDNDDFVDSLVTRGFYVACESRANYPRTLLSLASSLNMQYLDKAQAESYRALFAAIEYNEVARFLSSRGYVFINVSSGTVVTDFIPLADINYQYHEFLNEFEIALARMSVLRVLDYLDLGVSQNLRGQRLQAFSQIESMPEVSRPMFVFSHMLIPHPPYLFDRYGDAVFVEIPETGEGQWSGQAAMDAYVEQLIFVNKRVEAMVDEILTGSDIPPIIILQGDHGPMSTELSTGGFTHAYQVLSGGQPDHRTRIFLRERMSILNAYYLPGDADRHLYPSITPVNSFRLILDAYFGTEYGMLEDKIYFAPYEDPSAIVEIPADFVEDGACGAEDR